MNTAIDILKQARDWIDSHGTMGWVASMILGFIFAGPLGLVILFYALGTGRMGKCKNRRHGRHRFQSTGNEAFDSYRDETLKRLEDEQASFRKFMENLRAAKDKAEFDQFMDTREARGFDEAEDVPPAPKRDSDFGAMPNPA